jgi:hypothetical protein
MTMRFFLPLLLLWSIPVFADDLLPIGNFEAPAVKGRTLAAQGGDPSNGGRGPVWMSFKFEPETTGTAAAASSNGVVSGGLTDEVAHSGKQSLFIDFDHAKTPYQAATLISTMIPVVSGTEYQIGLWGRTDAKDLITSEDRPAYLKLEVDFFAKDANESVGDPFYSVLPIPGSKGHQPFFKPDAWNQFRVNLSTPPGAYYAQITWRWETAGSDPGEINGIMYFDDATLTGPANPNPAP